MPITGSTRWWIAERRRTALERGLEIASALALAVAVVSAVTGSGIKIGPWAVPVRDVWRPLILAAVLLGCRVLMARRGMAVGAPVRRMSEVLDAAFLIACWCGIATGVLLWATYQIRFCGGSDSYGYVSAAHALVEGRLIQPQPIADWLPVPDALSAATPLGWSPAPSGHAIVPGYPLGLPLVMAVFMLAAGPGAEFYVPLAAGIGILVLSYRLTARFTDWKTAAIATLVVAFSPAVTNVVIQPMSDVPAAFWYLLALYVLLAEPALLPAAGIAAGLGVWTRPSMLFMLPVLLWLIPRTRHAWLRFAAGLVPVGLAIAGLQWHLYGSPLRTGYGTVPGLFRLSMVAQNAPTYVKWIAITQTPLVFLAFAAGVWRAPRRLVVASVAGLALGVVPYLFKAPFFDDFGLIRYILPALIPCLLVAVIGVGDLAARYLPRHVAAAVLLAVAAAAAFHSYRIDVREGAFAGLIQESRYAAVGTWVLEHTPSESIVLADVHSGSLRFYASRTTLRFAVLTQDELAAAVREITRRGIACFAVVDGEAEELLFRERAPERPGGISRDPLARIRGAVIYRLQPGS